MKGEEKLLSFLKLSLLRGVSGDHRSFQISKLRKESLNPVMLHAIIITRGGSKGGEDLRGTQHRGGAGAYLGRASDVWEGEHHYRLRKKKRPPCQHSLS